MYSWLTNTAPTMKMTQLVVPVLETSIGCMILRFLLLASPGVQQLPGQRLLNFESLVNVFDAFALRTDDILRNIFIRVEFSFEQKEQNIWYR